MTVITRFAPSPTGYLHVGNIRTALVNWLFTRKHGGKFMLRIDDTDVVRSKDEYTEAIKEDLKWLGLDWEIFAHQSHRIDRYLQVKEQLLSMGRLYECFETQEEIEIKRKMQLSRGVPPIYDRAALKLTDSDKQKLIAEGRKPHYRFLLADEAIDWDDNVRGKTHFEGKNLSDPILIREDGTMTYILTSVVDDIDYNITNIIRGEDHVSNTAIQVQIFKALNATPPNFAHLALIKSKEGELSKRVGGFDIRSLREDGIMPMSINSLLAKIGTSLAVEAKVELQQLVNEFDISKFGRAIATYDQDDLIRLNHKIIANLPFSEVEEQLKKINLDGIDEQFWLSVRGNISKLNEISQWWQICKKDIKPVIDEIGFMEIAGRLLPAGELDETSWEKWSRHISETTGRKGKNLFMPLRKALTGMEHGPELKFMLPLIGREKILKRLCGMTA